MFEFKSVEGIPIDSRGKKNGRSTESRQVGANRAER